MNERRIVELSARVERMTIEELMQRRNEALGAIAYIDANLAHEPENIPPSSQKEVRYSRKLFHIEQVAYGVELTKRGISE